MFLYVYYSPGNGFHKSCDDIAIIKAWSRQQALKILSQYVDLQSLDHFWLYRLKISKFKKIKFISDY